MITPAASFTTANALLQKKPVYVLSIEGYTRAFSNAAVGSVLAPGTSAVVQSATFFIDFSAPGSCQATLANATPAGNLIFVFYFGIPTVTSINDTAGNSYALIYSSSWTGIASSVYVYVATSIGSAAGNVVSVNGGGSLFGSKEFYVVEVPAAYSAYTYGSANGLTPTAATCTVGANTVQVPRDHAPGSAWHIFQIALAQASGLNGGINLVFSQTVGVAQATWATFPGLVAYPPSGATSLVYELEATTNDWLVSLADLKVTVSDLEGSSNLADLVFNVQDRAQQLTADLASFVFEGKACWLMAGFQGTPIEDWIDGYNSTRLFTGVIDKVESDNSNLEYKFTVPSKNAKKLSQIIYTTGDDGFSTDSKHPRTLNGHPLDMFVSALQQCGVLLTDIDTAKIYYYRDTIFNGNSYVFYLTSAPACKDFIENEIMKPLGMYWRENNLGVVTVQSFYPALSGNGTYTPPSYPQATETINTITEVPVEQIAELVDQVTFRFDDNGNGTTAETVQRWDKAVTKYGLYGGHIVESKGMRSSFQGYYLGALIADLIFLRYGGKPILLDPLPLLWSECVLEPGDIIAVTLAFLPDRQAGVLGITTKAFEVLDRNWKFMEGICEPKLLEINLAAFKQYLITPNAEADYASDTAPNRAKYMYLCDAAGKYSTGAAANTLG